MDGFPPSRESQVSFKNHREYPFSQWSFRNPAAPLHVLMLPRSGNMHQYKTSVKPESIANTLIKDSTGKDNTFEAIFKENYADGVLVLQKKYYSL